MGGAVRWALGKVRCKVEAQLDSGLDGLMENNDTQILSSDSHIERISSDTTSPASIDTLLTPAPIQSLYEEFNLLVPLGNHFGFIGSTVFTYLREDTHAETLRKTLATFNEHGTDMVSEIGEGFIRSRSFYSHRHEEYSGKDIPVNITDEHARKLMDPMFQKRSKSDAQMAAKLWGNAAKILRTRVLPGLPRLQQELDAYIQDYCTRHHIIEEREQSILPYFMQDWLWGAIEPVRWNREEVELLPSDCETGGKLLRRLVGFLDRMEAHFLRLSQLELSELATSSFSSLSSLRDLYSNRVACIVILNRMDDMYAPMEKAFRRRPRK
ncbi:hypothetical protein FRB91_001563 [Serendipita sp. 411]|nr:hypothetical protein FRC18_003922 [Serendipita sp. 400]KAG8845677.1 hypothetical protein FRB91_001563 [Serendipita sp. 411]